MEIKYETHVSNLDQVQKFPANTVAESPQSAAKMDFVALVSGCALLSKQALVHCRGLSFERLNALVSTCF